VKKYILKLNIVILFSLILISCGEKKQKIEKIVVKKDEATRVETVIVKKIPFKSFAVYPGIFKEWDTYSIASEFAGTIEYLPYEIGDFIKKGEIVVKIDTSLIRARIKAAKVALDTAKTNFERVKKLYEKNLTTKSKYDNVKFQLDNAKAQLEILNTNLKKSIVRSPFDGYVLRKIRKKGEIAPLGVPLLTLIKLNPIKFILPIPEKDIFKISRGNVIDVKLVANGKKYKAVVYKISQVSNGGSHTVNAELELNNIKNYDGEFIFKPGMLGKAYLPVIREEKGLVLKLDSIMKTEKGNFVFINKNQKAQRIKVKIIATFGNNALISSENLKEGDEVITKGMYELINSSRIKVVKSEKTENKNNYQTILFNCKNNNFEIIENLLKQKSLKIVDLYKKKEGYKLEYKGDLPEFLSKCIINK